MRGLLREKVIKSLSSLFLMIAITACDNGESTSGGGITIIDNREPSITGVWGGPATQGEHTVALSYNLVQSGSDINGTCSCSNEHDVNSNVTGTISDNSISLTQTAGNCSYSINGTVNGYTSGSTMNLTATPPSGGGNCPAIDTSYTLTKQ